MTEEQLKRLAALEASDQAMASAIKENTTIAERDALMKAFADLFMAESDRDVLMLSCNGEHATLVLENLPLSGRMRQKQRNHSPSIEAPCAEFKCQLNQWGNEITR